MKISLHVNDNLELQLDPETELEALMLREMQSRCAKGQPVKLERVESRVVVVVSK